MSHQDLLIDTMKLACAEARKWLGATSPNPPVGAVALGAYGAILAVGAHTKAGEAHAEMAVLSLCGNQPIHTLCVTLEPCNHHGRTPPCTDALIKAGIKRMVIGVSDPNPHVIGGGIARLRAAGIEVITGVNESECQQLIHAYDHKMKTSKLWMTVKRAFDVRGSMIPAAGQKTFTSAASLKLTHRLRKKADAILTGSGTILADYPLFTVRHVTDYPDKRRLLAILDRRGRVPTSYLDQARHKGFEPVIYKDLDAAMADLAARNLLDVLVEAGPTLSSTLLDSDWWTMDVTINQAMPDVVNAHFNPNTALPFALKDFSWDYILPAD